MLQSEQPRALVVPVNRPARWCVVAAELACRDGPAEMEIHTTLAYWRKPEERMPEAWALEPGELLYLAHNGDVRGCAPIVGWVRSRGDRLTITVDPRRWRPVRLWWVFRDGSFNQGWRYVRWLPETEHGNRDWAEHGAHGGCLGA